MKKIIATILSVLMLITFIPIDNFVVLAAPDEQITITSIEPNKVSVNGGRITVRGTNFGTDKDSSVITATVSQGMNEEQAVIRTISNTEMSIQIPEGSSGLAYLDINRVGFGGASKEFTYIEDPVITGVITNTEIKILRDSKGEILKNPDGTAKKEKNTYIEIQGLNFNPSGEQNSITEVKFYAKDGAASERVAEIISQGSGFIKVKLPEGYTYGASYDIKVTNKYGTTATATDKNIKLAAHDISELSKLVANIFTDLDIHGTGFPSKDNLEVYIGTADATINFSNSSSINVTVPQVDSSGYHNVKVVDKVNNAAITLVGELQVLSAPKDFKVTSITPNAGTRDGGTEVRVIGTNLTRDMKVMFADKTAEFVRFETNEDGTTAIVVRTPSSTDIGSVNVTVINTLDNGQQILPNAYRYTQVANALMLSQINPTEGHETGGEKVWIYGRNFRKVNTDGGTIVSEEKQAELSSDRKELTFTSDKMKYEDPQTGVPVDVIRKRVVKTTFGGAVAEFGILHNDEVLDPDDVVAINQDDAIQMFFVLTPQVALKTTKDTLVDVTVEIKTNYYKVDGSGNIDIDNPIDWFTEKETLEKGFIYKPVPSKPELEVVYGSEVKNIPVIDENTTASMVKKAAGETVYIYGYDFREGAKVYFFKEPDNPANANNYLVPKNQGQIVEIATLDVSPITGKPINRIKVAVPNIGEIGEVTVVVQNADGQRTKTIGEFLKANPDINAKSKKVEFRQFYYLSTPKIDKVTPEFGATATEQRPSHRPVALIIGDMFLVNSYIENDITIIEKPTVYAVPREIPTEDILLSHQNKSDIYKDYMAEVLETTVVKDQKLIAVDGAKNKIGTKISVKLPSVPFNKAGLRDIIVINPDGGVARLSGAFEYKKPNQNKKYNVISVSPDKGAIEGGQKVTIEAQDFDYDIKETLITVTIGGELAKIESIKRSNQGNNVLLVEITTPPGTEGKKILQVINNADGGTGESEYTYTRVSTNPKITSITPKHGGPYTQVIIKGDDFVLPNPSATDPYEREGTRVLFNEHELNLITTTKDLDDGTTVTSEVYVADKNTIILTLPDNLPLGLKDVIIINPDTTRVTVKNGFTYLSPKSEPKIDSITPNEGTRDGGTKVVIIGEDFREDNIEVYFGEKKGVVEKVQEIEGQKYRLLVTTPSYPVDEKITDRVKVPVTVINSDGGSVTVQDGFTFRVPGSFPKLTYLDPKEGSTAGYETVIINGDDFRFDDVNKNSKPDEGEALPKVYFGWEEAVEVQYSSYGVLIVKTPPGEKDGQVDVTITNPDAGTVVLKNGFTYRMSKPTITSITPDTVTKFGGTEVTVVGTGFINGRAVGDQTGENLSQDSGDASAPIYGVDIDVEVLIGNEEASSKIVGRYAEVNIGDIKVTYDNRNVAVPNKVTVKYKDNPEKVFKLSPQQSRIIILQTGTGTKGTEGVKVAIKDNSLVVTRGLAPAVKYVDSNTLIVTTPAVETTGTKTLRIINRDKGTANGSIIIKNPDSKPEITNIEPKREVFKADGSNEVDYYVTESTIDGGLTFTITGKDFRKGVRVMIGNQEAEIISKNNEETLLYVRSPKGRDIDVNKPLRIVVINDDGESADSALSKIGDAQAPAYYIYRPKESNPTIESVNPNRGSIAGGDEIRITGNDFRIENITVRIGAREAKVITKESSYKELVVITPPGDILGPVDIFIRNEAALGEVILRNGFTYYSDPEITSITPREVHNTGGQKVTIKGNMFLPGVKVYIGNTQVTNVNLIDERTIELIAPPGELGPKDVKIENTDGGSYTLKNGITYVVPVPDSPTGFVAYPGHERSITLRWNKTEGAHRYKIFGTTRTRDGYEFIAETDSLEYILKDLKPDTRYYFRLWAINKYGESIDYDYTSATTLKSKYDDGDDKYDETESKETVVNYANGTISVDFPRSYKGSQYNLDLTDAKYNKYEKIKLTIPISAISYSSGGIWLNAKDIALYVPMYNLMFSTYYTAAKKENDANVIITVSRLDSTEKAKLTKGLTRKEKAKSEAYGIDIVLQNQRSLETIKITEGINFTIKLESGDLVKDNIYLAKFNPKDNKLSKVNSNITQSYDISKLQYIYHISAQVEENSKFIAIYKE